MPNGGWNPRIWILLKASPEKSFQDSASIQYNQPQKLRFCIDLLSQNEPKPHRKNPKMLILLKASFKKRHPMDVGSINWNPKVCISLRASSGKKIDSHRCAPNTWVSLEELLTFTSQNSPEPKKRKCSMHLSTRSRGLVWVYCEQNLMPRHTSRKATHIQYNQYTIPWD